LLFSYASTIITRLLCIGPEVSQEITEDTGDVELA
jgi:hypothetical protein